MNSENHDLEGTRVTPQLPKSRVVPVGQLGGSRHYPVRQNTEIAMQGRVRGQLPFVLTYVS